MTAFKQVKIGHQAAMDTPANIYLNLNGVKAYSSLIPECYEYAKEVHFVSDEQGNEFGQFENKDLALTKAHAMAKLSPEDRRAYDL